MIHMTQMYYVNLRNHADMQNSEIIMVEIINHGQPQTSFMTFGDRVRIEICDEAGNSVFGRIEQIVEKYDV